MSRIYEGLKINHLVAVREAGRRNKHLAWLFRCDCGSEIEVRLSHVLSEHTKSCGCFRQARARDRSTKHGSHRTPTYHSWQSMLERCRNPNQTSYAYYGGRGISVCLRWNEFENFLADMGERPSNKTLHRINNEENYNPENCVWATPLEQARAQKRTIFVEVSGRKTSLVDACVELGVPYTQIIWRIRVKNQTFEEAVEAERRKRPPAVA